VPSGIIVVRRHGFSMLCGNCAESAALRQAFPSDIGGLYLASEIEAFAEDSTKRIAGDDRGTVNLNDMTPRETPPQSSAEGQGGFQGQSEGTDAPGAENASQEPPAAHAATDEIPEGHDTGGDEVDPEEELNSYAYEISQCPSVMMLNKLAQDAEKARPEVRGRALKMIADKRRELERTGKGGKQQAALPGAQ
jgi:hypothetical protein